MGQRLKGDCTAGIIATLTIISVFFLVISTLVYDCIFLWIICELGSIVIFSILVLIVLIEGDIF